MTRSGPLRVLIVDDEPPARRKLRRLLERDPGMRIVGEAGNGPDAIAAIGKHVPDVVFLDIQMGQVSGFDVLEALESEALPRIVFVTAYDEYAVRAFEVAAVDYLLKPYDAERLAVAVDRVRRRGSGEDSADALDARLRELMAAVRRPAPTRLLVKKRDRGLLIEVRDIDWIRAAGNYVELHVGGEEYLLRETLEGLGDRLDPETFLRVHRSSIVNASRIREIQPASHGDHLILMADGARVRLSRRYRDRLPDDIRRHL